MERAHVSGLSLGAATGMWLAAKYPERVKSLSLHSGWPKSDPFLKTVVGGWQTIAKGRDNVEDMIIQGIFPWCFTPELFCGQTGLYRRARGVRSQSAETTAPSFHPPVECGDRP